MKILSVSELKATLSEQLRLVRSGEEVLVTARGRPVARLVPATPHAGEDAAVLAELEEAGLVRPGTGRLPDGFGALVRGVDPEALLRRAVTDEREGGW